MHSSIGEQFAQALAAKDSERMRALLAEPIDFQALTPGRHWQASTPELVIDEIILGVWFGPRTTTSTNSARSAPARSPTGNE